MKKDRENLHQQFVELGRARNKLTYELLHILPEIYAQEIHLQKGYPNIYEYAGKLAGLSKSVVQKVLRAEPHLEEKPRLKEAIAKVGIHKVDMVARIATPENEAAWAEKVENMSKPALQELAKEVRMKEVEKSLPGENFSFGKCDAPPQKMTIDMDEEMQFLFLRLKNRHGKNLSNKAAMKILLKRLVAEEFSEKKTRKSKKIVKVTRYIPAERKREAMAETQGQCSYPRCGRPAEQIHHPDRFSEVRSHKNLKPVCRIHHEFAHNGLIEEERSGVEEWRLGFGELQEADKLYLKFRKQRI